MILSAVVGPEQAGMRLDDGAKALFPQLSKGEIRKIIDWGGCTIDQALVRVASRTLREGDELILGVMEAERRVELIYNREDMLHEDADYLAINKEPGINSQRTPYQLKGTVEYAVAMYLKTCGINEPARVIHRLDRGTSGVMFFPQEQTERHLHLAAAQGRKGGKGVLGARTGRSRGRLLGGGRTHRQDWQIPVWRGLAGQERPHLLQGAPTGEGSDAGGGPAARGAHHQIRVHLLHHGFPIIATLRMVTCRHPG